MKVAKRYLAAGAAVLLSACSDAVVPGNDFMGVEVRNSLDAAAVFGVVELETARTELAQYGPFDIVLQPGETRFVPSDSIFGYSSSAERAVVSWWLSDIEGNLISQGPLDTLRIVEQLR